MIEFEPDRPEVLLLRIEMKKREIVITVESERQSLTLQRESVRRISNAFQLSLFAARYCRQTLQTKNLYILSD
jgi:hypothetical protein